MPTSYHGYISEVVEEVRKQKPMSVLDIGVGFGKWGHLFREYLDVMNGRVFKNEWKVRIDGVEIFAPYIMEHQKNVYSNIYVGDILEVIDQVPHYDLVFTSDVIEHIDKEKAKELIQKIRSKCKVFVAVVPMGKVWLNSQGALYGNDHEAHISDWYDEDFKPYASCKRFMCNNKPIDVFVIK